MKKNFRCNDCDEWCCEKKAQLITHYRKEHSDNPWGLWTAVDDIGDEFANTLLRQMENRNHSNICARDTRESDLKVKAEAYDKLVRDYDELCRRLQMVHLAIGGSPYRNG